MDEHLRTSYKEWLLPINYPYCQHCTEVIFLSLPPGKYWHFKCVVKRLAIINGEV